MPTDTHTSTRADTTHSLVPKKFIVIRVFLNLNGPATQNVVKNGVFARNIDLLQFATVVLDATTTMMDSNAI